MLSECSSLDWLCSLLLDLTWTTLAATEMGGTISGEFVRGSPYSSFSSKLLMNSKRYSGGCILWLLLGIQWPGMSLILGSHLQLLLMQFPKGVFQGLLQLHAAACSDPTLPDHPFPGGHHMVCLHRSWLLCTTHSSAEFHQHHPGHQPGLHHCITRSVDCCLPGLHGQCRSGS